MGEWLGGKEGRVVRWKGGRFLVLSQDGGMQGESKISSIFF